jgi:hypothetical protein
MKGYKGFRKGLICKEKQYAENTVFEEEAAVICEKGMHFCKNPFDVLDYYGFVDEKGSMNEFAEVEALAETDTNDNKKYCTTKLKVGAKLSFAGFVKTCVDFVLEKTTLEMGDADENKIGSSGNYAKIGSSGDSAQIGSSGNYAQIGSSGYSAKIGSSGDSAQIGSSGNYAQIGSSGYSAKIGSSGDYAKISSTGKDSVICCAGHNSIVKAKKGSWITLSEWEYSEEKKRVIPLCVKTEYVDGERIKADTFYLLVKGEFKEVN